MVRGGGGNYVGDLSRRVTHLIVAKPEGKKFVAARNWGIRTVSIEWLHDSVERGMILNEECYDPTLPAEERGKGAWIRRDIKRAPLRKRPRDGVSAPPGDDGRRKLRKTASMKLTSQRDNLWGDILVKQSSMDLSNLASADSSMLDDQSISVISMPAQACPTTSTSDSAQPIPYDRGQHAEAGVFSSCRFYVHGFSRNKQEIIHGHITSHGGQISSSIKDVGLSIHNELSDRRYIIVPQSSQPASHPAFPEGIHVVTEFYIERCVHNKVLYNPNEHVLGRPFPQFPIKGFNSLIICTAGFRNETLNQVEKAVLQLGAKFSERLNAQCSLLICPSIESARKQKLAFAVKSKVPVVDAEWLWQCVTTGCLVPWKNYLLRGFPQEVDTERAAVGSKEMDKTVRSEPEPVPKQITKSAHATSGMKHGIDMTAFDNDTPMPRNAVVEPKDTAKSTYETAPTNQENDQGVEPPTNSTPLSEKTSNALNKSPSPQKTSRSPRKLRRFPTGGEVGDSQSDDELDASLGEAKEEEDASKREEEERKRQAEQLRAAERQEMSKKLTSLMPTDGISHEGDGARPQSAPRQRRKREVLGRAVSNVSAASSASIESLPHPSSSSLSNLRRTESAASRPSSNNQTTAGAFGLLDKMMMQHSGESNHTVDNNGGDSPPRGTQLEYDNPEARKHRATLLNRMMAGSSKQDAAAGESRQPQEKIVSAGPTTTGPTTRASRRR